MSSNSRGQGWSAPPEGILLRILSLANTQTRLRAALVSPHWANAAAAATTAIRCNPKHSTAALHQYLGKHGQHVTSLSFNAAKISDREAVQVFLVKQLPCPNLLDFEFEGKGGQLLPPWWPGGPPHLLQAATGLTSLSFKMSSEVRGFCPSLSLLTDLRQLQSLQVEVERHKDQADPAAVAQDTLDGAILAQLPHLTKLKLKDRVRISTLRHISCLTALQELSVQLKYAVIETAAADGSESKGNDQPQLPTLSKLVLAAPDMAINSRTYPWLAQLPALRSAAFCQGVLEPQVIFAAPQLTELTVTPGTEIAGGAAGLLEFLSSVRSLQQLAAACSLQP